MSKHTHAFQAEVAQLLHLVTHSLYSNKEIFLRELVSNASDACDKLRFEALDNDSLYEGDSELGVRVSFDKDKKTLTIEDNGIGMSQTEAVDHLGTIAKSGTREFMKKLNDDQQSNAKDQGALIGQFGVGFYSGFIVADRITVETRRAGRGPDPAGRAGSPAHERRRAKAFPGLREDPDGTPLRERERKREWKWPLPRPEQVEQRQRSCRKRTRQRERSWVGGRV